MSERDEVLRDFRREMPGMPTADYAVLPMTLLFRIERALEEWAGRAVQDGLDPERLAQILAAAEGFPGKPSLKNRKLAEYIIEALRAAPPSKPVIGEGER